MARLGTERRGWAVPGVAGQGLERQGEVGQESAPFSFFSFIIFTKNSNLNCAQVYDIVWDNAAGHCEAGLGMVWLGGAWKGKGFL